MTDREHTSPEEIYDRMALEQARRRNLALQATDMMSEILGTEVTIPALVILAGDDEPTDVRLKARRALRCTESIARENSEIVAAVGEKNLYHYVEGVLIFGASDTLYLQLMETYGLNAEEVTGLYALRELIAEHTNGQRPGMPTIVHALNQLGVSVQSAAQDPEEALIAFDKAGFITDYLERKTGNRTYFTQFNQVALRPSPYKPTPRLLEDDIDGSLSTAINDALKYNLRNPEESDEGEDIWQAKNVEDCLKSLGF